jgi:branched-chain amino acid transport system ATP-binding protein
MRTHLDHAPGALEPGSEALMAQGLSLRGVSAWYGAAQALDTLDLDIPPGALVVLHGPNGAGKTTVLRAICQQVKTTGRIVLDGQALHGRTTDAIARCGVLHIPEGRGGFTALSVAENLRLGAWQHAWSRARMRQALDAVYQRFPVLHARRHQQAGTLSGGEQQMLALGRALMAEARILLLDEPCLGLAPATADQVRADLRALNQRSGLSMLVVEPQAEAARALSEHIVALDHGRRLDTPTPRRCSA